ncbi:MAG: UDP-N-acetylmuramoyl-L-alanyl-D-glutamate--2,6-diaminopimelate ligase [Candidatus Endobugula sp.]|jgi:UDP-N-acetylmuramoyl-L-alanyl-D-glutamate--2,6-diaminopimelate ligase
MMAVYTKQAPLFTLGQLLYAQLEKVKPVLTDDIANITVSGLSIDSREINVGDVFVALPGVHTHGEKYIAAAVKQGASAVLCDVSDAGSSDDVVVDYYDTTPIIFIRDLGCHLSEIAGNFYGHPTRHMPVVGITGTNGKTSCAQIYAQLAALNGKRAGVVGTIGFGVCQPGKSLIPSSTLSLVSTGMTTPDAVNAQRICAELVSPINNKQSDKHSAVDCIVMEVSSHGLSQGRVAAMGIDAAVFTNLSHDHLDYHDDMAAYGAAKAKLFVMSSVKQVVLNLDDEFTPSLIDLVDESVSIVTYSVSNADADLYLSNVRSGESQLLADLHVGQSVYPLATPLIGRFNLANLLAVLSVFSTENISAHQLSHIVSLVQYITPAEGRMELIPNAAGLQVIVDFAHTPAALDNVLQAISEYTQGDIYCVFGCGGDRDQAKRPLMAKIAERYAQHIIVTNDNPRTESPDKIISDVVQGFTAKTPQVIADRKTAIRVAITQAKVGDVVIIAGKGHENHQIIGQQKIPFSDRAVARAALEKRERVA